MNRIIRLSYVVCAAVLSQPICAAVTLVEPTELQVGHWVEARGHLESGGVFVAEKLELVDPQRYEEIIGVPTQVSGQGFWLLDKHVSFDEQTRFDNVGSNELAQRRLKVEGYYRGSSFVAREVAARSPGRERVVGRIDHVGTKRDDVQLQILGYRVHVESDTLVEAEKPVDAYETSGPRYMNLPVITDDEDDLFGEGLRLSERLRFQGQIEGRSLSESNFDLDDAGAEDRDENRVSARARLLWLPRRDLHAVFELRHEQRWRDDQQDGRTKRSETDIGEAYVAMQNIGSSGMDLTVGRQDFDDEREWLYDTNLDGIRLIARPWGMRAEVSASRTLSDGTPRDEDATNFMVYLSNGDEDLELAAYLIHRDIDTLVGEKPTHLGVRAIGEWSKRGQGWVDMAMLRGSRAGRDLEAWGLDLGTTWTFERLPIYLTAGLAIGTGGDTASGQDRGFRQTGLQDNNAKFGGVTSFRYYGELVDPELANLRIVTLGIGARVAPRTSLDLVYHRYDQETAVNQLVETELGDSPNGLSTQLGWGMDLILGMRRSEFWDIELVGAYFKPGNAFDNRDDAFFAKAQLRFRF